MSMSKLLKYLHLQSVPPSESAKNTDPTMPSTIPEKAADAISSESELETLAVNISANSATLSNFLRAGNLPQPSFKRDAPTTVLPLSAPDEIKAARQALIEASLRAFQLATGPSEYLPNLAMGVCCALITSVESSWVVES
jgi:hypothetical protein